MKNVKNGKLHREKAVESLKTILLFVSCFTFFSFSFSNCTVRTAIRRRKVLDKRSHKHTAAFEDKLPWGEAHKKKKKEEKHETSSVHYTTRKLRDQLESTRLWVGERTGAQRYLKSFLQL